MSHQIPSFRYNSGLNVAVTRNIPISIYIAQNRIRQTDKLCVRSDIRWCRIKQIFQYIYINLWVY